MTTVYVVTYDHDSEASDYEAVFKELQNFGPWCHFISNTWLIETKATAESIYERLQPYLDDHINLLIVEAGSQCQGSLPESAWEWISPRIKTKEHA